MTASIVLTSIDQRGVATVTLNRPEVHNAYSGALIDALSTAVAALAADPRVRFQSCVPTASTSRPAPISPDCARSRAGRSTTTSRSRVAPRSRCSL